MVAEWSNQMTPTQRITKASQAADAPHSAHPASIPSAPAAPLGQVSDGLFHHRDVEAANTRVERRLDDSRERRKTRRQPKRRPKAVKFIYFRQK